MARLKSDFVGDLKGDARMPRYQRLAEALRQEVVGQRWKPGDRLPSENDIADAYGVAPGTARQALAQLVKEGLLERAHGRGTFVRRPSFDQSLFRFFRFSGEDGVRAVPESRILRRVVTAAPRNVARALKIEEGAETINMSRLRLIGEEPAVAEDIWLPLPRLGKFLDVELDDVGPLLYPVYDQVCGEVVARAEEALTVETATPEIARLLRLPAGAPVIVIERLALGFHDAPIEWRRSRGAGERFKYHTEIR